MNAMLAYVNASDFQLFGRVQAWRPPRWFRLWMLLATRLADGWIYLALTLALLCEGGRGRRVMAAGCVAASLGNLVLVAIKHRVKRLRPCELAPHVRYAVKPPDRWSFPSGHSQNAFSVGLLVALAFPAGAPLALGLAASVAASRIVLGMHFLSDVLAGALLGALMGAGAYVCLC